MPPPPVEIGPIHETGLQVLRNLPRCFATSGSSEEHWSAYRLLGAARCFEIRLPDQSLSDHIRDVVRDEGLYAGATDLDALHECTGRLHDIARGEGKEPLEWAQHLEALLEDIFHQHEEGKLTDVELAAMLCGVAHVGLVTLIPKSHDLILSAAAKIHGLMLVSKLDEEFREEYKETIRRFLIHIGEQKKVHNAG